MSKRLFVTRIVAFLFFAAGAVELIEAEFRDSLWFYGLSAGLLILALIWNERAREVKEDER